MSWTITIKGNNVDDILTAESITINIYGVRPHLIDGSEVADYPEGLYRRSTAYHLALEVTPQEFYVEPMDDGSHDTLTYFELMRILASDYLWLDAVGSDVLRFTHAVRGLIPAGVITLPIELRLYDYSDYAANFDEGINDMTFTLITPEFFTVPS